MDTVSKPLVILAGLCLINTLAALLSLFIKLGWIAQILLFIPGMAFGWRMWRKRAGRFSFKMPGISWLIGILLVLVFLTVLENSTHSPTNPDTGIYHAQAIRWMETYPAVPGLGNLHSRLAYNSNWLVLNAFFSFAFLGLRSFHVLAGAFVLTALAYLVQGVQQLLKGSIRYGNIFKLILIPLLFYTVGAQISSPGTDLPADILIWVTLAVWLDNIEIPKGQAGAAPGEIFIFIFSICLVTIKLSSLSILLLAAFIFFRQYHQDRKIAGRYLVLAIILLAPWCARNLILSGYWVYPVPAIVRLSPDWDWKIPLERVIQEQKAILAWARLPQADAQEVLALPLASWLRQWFENQTANRQALILGGLASPIVFTVGAWLGSRKKGLTGPYFLAYIVSYSGLIFWLFAAPDMRFGYGVLVATVILTCVPFLYWVLTPFRWQGRAVLQKMLATALILLVILYQGSVLQRSLDASSLSSRLVLPADYGALPTLPCNIHGTNLLCAEYYNECWYEPFPCIPPGSADEQVEMRGSTLRDGFRSIPRQ
jgi:hypothetical protein